MRFNKKLSAKYFTLSMLLILIAGLLFLTGLYYLLNIQYQPIRGGFVNGPVTTAPKTLRLDLDQPGDDSLSFTPSIIISGQTAPKISVLIMTDNDNLVIQSKADGSFSTVLNLEDGVNQIIAAVFDSTGDSRSIKRTVYYSKEKL